MLLRLATATTAAAFALIAAAAPAAAHERLVSADPEQGVALATAPTTVTLTFSGTVEATAESIRVTGRDGTDWVVSDVTPSGTKITAKVRAQGLPGTQVLAYRVTSPDGHTMTGSYTFDVETFTATTTAPTTTTPATSAQAPAATAPPVADSPAPDEPGGPSGWLWFVIGAAVAAALGAVVAAKRRR